MSEGQWIAFDSTVHIIYYRGWHSNHVAFSFRLWWMLIGGYINESFSYIQPRGVPLKLHGEFMTPLEEKALITNWKPNSGNEIIVPLRYCWLLTLPFNSLTTNPEPRHWSCFRSDYRQWRRGFGWRADNQLINRSQFDNRGSGNKISRLFVSFRSVIDIAVVIIRCLLTPRRANETAWEVTVRHRRKIRLTSW